MFVVGRAFFERFSRNEDGTIVKFLHPKDVQAFMSRLVDPSKWMQHVKAYLKNANEDILRDKRLLFRIECQGFRTFPEPG